MDASLPHLAPEILNAMEERRLRLVMYAFGVVHHFIELEQLTPPQVQAITIKLLDDLFHWPMDTTVALVDMAIEGTAMPEVREILRIAMEDYCNWEDGDSDACHGLGQIVAAIGTEED
jgi:hypothetical protein